MRYAKRLRPPWKLQLVKLFLKWSWRLLEQKPIDIQADLKTATNGQNQIMGYKLVVEEFELFEFKTPNPTNADETEATEHPKFIEELISEVDTEYLNKYPNLIKKENDTPNKQAGDPNQE